jgi:hypothetical protein
VRQPVREARLAEAVADQLLGFCYANVDGDFVHCDVAESSGGRRAAHRVRAPQQRSRVCLERRVPIGRTPTVRARSLVHTIADLTAAGIAVHARQDRAIRARDADKLRETPFRMDQVVEHERGDASVDRVVHQRSSSSSPNASSQPKVDMMPTVCAGRVVHVWPKRTSAASSTAVVARWPSKHVVGAGWSVR